MRPSSLSHKFRARELMLLIYYMPSGAEEEKRARRKKKRRAGIHIHGGFLPTPEPPFSLSRSGNGVNKLRPKNASSSSTLPGMKEGGKKMARPLTSPLADVIVS